MTILPALTPKFIRLLFPKYTWKMKAGSEKVLYLTFDDGPTPEITEQVLAILNQYNAKATFFCIGDNIRKYPEIFESIINQGHEIGNHTFNHLKGWQTNNCNYLENVNLCNSQIAIHRNPSKLFRPPHGRIKNSQAKSLLKRGYNIIMWDVLSFDWKQNLNPEKCYHNVKNNASSGSIIVFHDSKKASQRMLYALPKTLNHFSKQGYVFKSI